MSVGWGLSPWRGQSPLVAVNKRGLTPFIQTSGRSRR
jgi:hypothetical protein